jgi:L-threonylcarbamoyladenylate synthase
MKRIVLAEAPIDTVIAETINVLEAGGLVIFPTETVYGAGVDATSQGGVDKLLAYKSRREGKPLSIAVTDITMAQRYVAVNDQAVALYQQFLPGPVTVVSKGLGSVAKGVESEFGTLGIRIPAYPLLLQLIQKYNKPITATSANASGKKRPYTIDDALSELSQKQKNLIDLVLDAGELPKNEPSTVIDTTLSTPLTMRAGAIAKLNTKSTQAFFSPSEEETKNLAGKLVLKNWNSVKETGLVIGLDGALGTGKTVFTKGVADFLQITETITSPTYTYIEEYEFERHGVRGMLYHLDLWKVESEEELQRLELKELIQPNNVIVIEWWSQVSHWLKPILAEKQCPLIEVAISDAENGRNISVNET